EDDPKGLFLLMGAKMHWTSVVAGKGWGQAKPVERAFGVGGLDDVFGILPSWMFTAIVAVIVLLIIGIIFARLYRRASAEQAFV
ncbi:hypothetical protein MJM28_30990, partial [Salmonella enterica subsp. enterica serovar Montevideo]|nr:hypothetical protein [Salmonella enterica subsp. enterica serovar Montevideo]